MVLGLSGNDGGTFNTHVRYSIAQSVCIPQGFSPVAFATGADGTMGTVEEK
jgi:hypothetical protein